MYWLDIKIDSFNYINLICSQAPPLPDCQCLGKTKTSIDTRNNATLYVVKVLNMRWRSQVTLIIYNVTVSVIDHPNKMFEFSVYFEKVGNYKKVIRQV